MKVLHVIPQSEKGNSFIFAKREHNLLRRIDFVDASVFYLNTRKGLPSICRQFYELFRFVKNNNIEIVHSQYGTITSVISLLVSFRRKLVVTYRGSDINGNSDVGFIRSRIAVLLSWLSMHFSDACIFVSPGLTSRCPYLGNTSTIIPSGVDIEEFRPFSEREAKEKLGLDPAVKYLFFYSANNSKNKRKDLALSAIQLLKQRGMNHFSLLDLKGSVCPQEIPYYTNSSSALLMLSDNEGSPTVVQEALACGIPVVTVDVGDAKSMIAGVRNCFLVDRTPESIMEGILKATSMGPVSPSPSTLDKISLQKSVVRIAGLYQSLFQGAPSENLEDHSPRSNKNCYVGSR